MKRLKLILIVLLLLANFFLLDFPGAKIVLYGLIAVILFNKYYTNHVEKSFAVKRFMDTNRVFAGSSEINSLVVSNHSSLPIHALHLMDYADLNISIEQTHNFLFSMDSNKQELLDYTIFGKKRGQFNVGPTTIKFSDIMGMFSFRTEIDTVKKVVVFPNILSIANMPYKSTQPYGIIKNPMPIFEDPSIVVGLREYQYGDEIKNINWKVSARYDRLFVNTHQPSISSGSLILLNLTEDDYQFRNRDYYIEQSIEVAASLVRSLFVLRQEVGVTVNCRIDKIDSILRSGVNKGEAHFTNILGNLALIEPNKKLPFKEVLDPSTLALSWGTSIYVLTPRLDELSLFRLIDMYQAGHKVIILNTGPEINKELSLWNVGFASYFTELESNIIRLMRI